MANGIANNEKRRKKQISKPAEQKEKSNVCVSSFAKTPTRGIVGFKGLSISDELKKQIENGEYKAIKLSDRPLQTERPIQQAKTVKEAETRD